MKQDIIKCNNLKEYMAETLKKYKDRIAYKIKHKEGKNVSSFLRLICSYQ